MNDSDQSQGKTIEERLSTIINPAPTQSAEIQPEPTPSSKDPAEEVETQPVDEEQEALAASKNPERTKAYIEKLKEENRKLKEQSTPPTPTESPFEIPEPKAEEPPLSHLPTPEEFIDQSGNLDIDGFNKKLREVSDRAYLSQLEAQKAQEAIAKFEHNQQTKEALDKFPSLDPTKKDSFDPRFAELVKRELIANIEMSKRGIERKLSYAEVAQKVTGFYQPVNVAKVKEETVAQIKQAQQQRQQGPIESGKGEQRFTQDTLEDLRARTRRNDGAALSERLKALGI